MGIFSKIKEGLKKTRDTIAYNLNKLFTGGVLTDAFYEDLEDILLSADVGAVTTDRILAELREVVDEKRIRDTAAVKSELKILLKNLLDENEKPVYSYPLILMVSGVNGVGKTTAMGKLAGRFKQAGKSVLLVAADTFRAAAADQLEIWSNRAGVRLVRQSEGADPGSVVYDALQSAKSRGDDVILIDTAGRLHNKKNLMDELSKITRIIGREMPEAQYLNYIVLDATTGQNAIAQVEVFNEAVDIDGIILTKLDGTAKGGVVLAVAGELNVPVVYIGVGEKIDDLQDFDAEQFVEALVN
ncbi:MAG: signal recognition particle-docking protein FtsY [Clostridiales bacterium]|jgi:fused signal recognition particle receptor|nr:signal recognition particle-docking protein FtsY [Clostridiales bacterium]